MTDTEKRLIRVFLSRASMENNEALADALWYDPNELRNTARHLIASISNSRGTKRDDE